MPRTRVVAATAGKNRPPRAPFEVPRMQDVVGPSPSPLPVLFCVPRLRPDQSRGFAFLA
jgi:hypothetical protein